MQITLYKCNRERSRDKLKLYLHFLNANGRLTSQGGDIQQGAHTHKFAWLINSFMTEGPIEYQSIDLYCKLIDSFLYDMNFRHERANKLVREVK